MLDFLAQQAVVHYVGNGVVERNHDLHTEPEGAVSVGWERGAGQDIVVAVARLSGIVQCGLVAFHSFVGVLVVHCGVEYVGGVVG